MTFERSSGILAHITSFPSKHGIGDLGSGAYKFINFLHKSKQKIWQVLPLCPTSFGDSPYQGFSTFAGNPLLISPELLAKEGYLTKEHIEQGFLGSDIAIDYGKVIEYKTSLFRKAFEAFKNFATSSQKQAFNNFCSENESWLLDYSLFIALKQHYISIRKNTAETEQYLEYKKMHEDKLLSKIELELKTEVKVEAEFKVRQKEIINTINDCYYGASWDSWDNDIKNRTSEALEFWKEKLHDEIQYNNFLQYEFFRQWFLLKAYANYAEVSIVGDIPIFVAMDSADVWANKELFEFDSKGFPTSVAGVPPDYFSATGQLWGNPLYNWEVHKKTDYKWWVDRIRATLSIVDILRIDHFRGFDSYWAVPYGEKTAVNGQWLKAPGKELFDTISKQLGDFSKKSKQQWCNQMFDNLKEICDLANPIECMEQIEQLFKDVSSGAGALPIIAEDLGIITQSVEQLRDSLNLPGMKVLQFAFDGYRANTHLTHNYKTSNCVIYTGTHDNDTTASWYEKLDDKQKDLFRRYLNVSGERPSWDMIRLAFSSVAVFAIFPIQDVLCLGEEARMNTPGVASGNWKFRFTEDMLKDEDASWLESLGILFNRNIHTKNIKLEKVGEWYI